MRGGSAISLFLLLFLYLVSGCKEKPLLVDFDMNAPALSSLRSVKLSQFLGNYKKIALEGVESFKTTGFPRIIKREGIFYVLSSSQCSLFDSKGMFIRTVIFPPLFEMEGMRVAGYGIYYIDGKTELWIGEEYPEFKIHRISLEDGKKIDEISIDLPFSDFKRISENRIILALVQNHYSLGVCNLEGRIEKYRLKKKMKDVPDGGIFMKYGDSYLFQYMLTTLAAYYDQEANDFREILLVDDDQYVNTWQIQADLMMKYGIMRGYGLSVNNYNAITYMLNTKEMIMLSFIKKENKYLSIRRGKGKFQSVELLPNKYNNLENDISFFKDANLQLLLSFDGRTDSDESILFYLIDDRKEPFKSKKRGVSIIEVFD